MLLEAAVANAEGKHESALELMLPCLDLPVDSLAKQVYEDALVAADALGREADVRAILGRIEAMPQGIQTPVLRGHALRFRARMGDEPDDRYRAAAALFREYGLVLIAARTQLDHAEWLLHEDRADEAEALLAEARAVFEKRGVRPWLERLDPGPVATIAEAQ